MKTRIVVTSTADADAANIISRLYKSAGPLIATNYNTRFEKLFDRLADHPDLGSPRPKLGPHIRIALVLPYIVVYRHIEGADILNIIRVLHGRRRLTRKMVEYEV